LSVHAKYSGVLKTQDLPHPLLRRGVKNGCPFTQNTREYYKTQSQ